MHLFRERGEMAASYRTFGGRGEMVHYGLRPNAPYGHDLAFRPACAAWDAFRLSLVGPQRIGGPQRRAGDAGWPCVGWAGLGLASSTGRDKKRSILRPRVSLSGGLGQGGRFTPLP